ncbi:hypothetical protein MHYP_G00243880 [Metynnis hypsauchen]
MMNSQLLLLLPGPSSSNCQTTKLIVECLPDFSFFTEFSSVQEHEPHKRNSVPNRRLAQNTIDHLYGRLHSKFFASLSLN